MAKIKKISTNKKLYAETLRNIADDIEKGTIDGLVLACCKHTGLVEDAGLRYAAAANNQTATVKLLAQTDVIASYLTKSLSSDAKKKNDKREK